MATQPRLTAAKKNHARSGHFPLLLLSASLALLLVILAVTWRQAANPATRHYLKGMDDIASRRPDLAEQEWLAGTRAAPADPRCFEMLGNLYTTLHRPEAAVEWLSQAAAKDPQNGQTWLELAAAEKSDRKFSHALTAAQHAAELLPNDADALFLYGAMESKNHKWRGAVATLRSACARRKKDLRFLFALASAEIDTNDLAAAETHINAYMQRRPDDPLALYALATIYSQRPPTPAAIAASIRFAERALPGMRSDERIYTLLGQVYLNAGRVRDALHVFQQGDQVAPNSEQILHGLVTCYARVNDARMLAETGKRLEAASARHARIDHLQHVMGFQPENVTAGLELAQLTEADQQYAAALAYYQDMAHRFPDNAQAHTELFAFQERMFARHGWKRTRDGWAPPHPLPTGQ